MQFDVIIGNPPYQLGQSGGDAVGGFAMPIYQKFVQAAKSLDPRYLVMVTPSRWFAGGRGLDEFRSEMLADKRMRALVDFPDASEAFPGVEIVAVSVTSFGTFVERRLRGHYDLWWQADVAADDSGAWRCYDVFVRDNEAVPILEKVLSSMPRTASSPVLKGLGDTAVQHSQPTSEDARESRRQ